MPETNQTITFEQMKGTIGSLVYLWSGIELTLNESIEVIRSGKNPKPVHGISRSLDTWAQAVNEQHENRPLQADLCKRLVKMLKEALVIRNLVCHGLVSIQSKNFADQDEAHLSVKLGYDARILTWHQLDEMFGWMSRTKWLINDLTDAAIESDALRANARLRAWEGFPVQK